MTTPPVTDMSVQRVLVITAHPDDVDFGAAGTVASWTAAGVDVTYCVCTSGDAGGGDHTDGVDMAELRQREQRAAAQAVGVSEVRFLGYPDGQVCADLGLRRDITKAIREVRPDRVVTHSPEINWSRIVISHPDHRAVGEAALAAVYPDARNRYAHRDLLEQFGLQPWTVRELWLSGTPDERINHAVDMTDYFEAKMAALRAHRSQTAHRDDLEQAIRAHLERNARRHGLGADRLAEAFQVVETA